MLDTTNGHDNASQTQLRLIIKIVMQHHAQCNTTSLNNRNTVAASSHIFHLWLPFSIKNHIHKNNHEFWANIITVNFPQFYFKFTTAIFTSFSASGSHAWLQCERTQAWISPREVVFITTATALGTGCTPLLQCLGWLGLPPSVGQ